MADAPGPWETLRRELEAMPQDPAPRAHPMYWMSRAKRAADFIGHIRFDTARFFAKVNPYPKPFRHTWLRAEDGVRIAAWVGPHRITQPAPWGVVLVPGMFGTKDDTIHKRRAIRMWRSWRVPVVAIDLRGFGESSGISTAGWKEAFDVLAAARHLRDVCHVQRVAVVAESMGGAAALNAAGMDGASGEDLLGGGLVTWSAFVDARDAASYISAKPALDHPFASQWAGFRRLLSLKSMGGYESFTDYLDDAARVNGLADAEELYELANPKQRVHEIRTPTLAIHSRDDPVVPVRHARRMERYCADMDNVQVLVTDWGGHTAFESRDPRWMWSVQARWLGEANGVTLPLPGQGVPTPR